LERRLEASVSAIHPSTGKEGLHIAIEALQQTWKAYLDAYGDVAADERERLPRQSVTDDVVFTGPNEEDKGFGKLVEHIERRNLISNL
jgi:glycosyltransferase involved in cell wall biosynthesis